MRLLIVTQIVDTQDTILSFFPRWIKEFAQYCESVEVICLKEGEHILPENVTVHSLGKEVQAVSKFTYVYRLLKLSWSLRHEYDMVFVHMNPEYVLSGGLLWRLLGKRVALWYAHGTVSRALRLAIPLTHVIYSASKESFRHTTEKLRVIGHGIDTKRFVPKVVQKDIDLVTVGRISASKNLETLIDVLALVREKVSATLTLVGEPIGPEQQAYKKKIQEYAEQKKMTPYVTYLGTVTQEHLPDVLARSKVFVHAASNGSLDKALLEPLLMEVPVISSAEGAASLPLGQWQVSDTVHFAGAVIKVLQSDTTVQTKELRQYVETEHSLSALVPKILNV